jgi:hypothetical protein
MVSHTSALVICLVASASALPATMTAAYKVRVFPLSFRGRGSWVQALLRLLLRRDLCACDIVWHQPPLRRSLQVRQNASDQNPVARQGRGAHRGCIIQRQPVRCRLPGVWCRLQWWCWRARHGYFWHCRCPRRGLQKTEGGRPRLGRHRSGERRFWRVRGFENV